MWICAKLKLAVEDTSSTILRRGWPATETQGKIRQKCNKSRRDGQKQLTNFNDKTIMTNTIRLRD